MNKVDIPISVGDHMAEPQDPSSKLTTNTAGNSDR